MTQEIRSKINDWLRFLNEPVPATEDDLLRLEALLDALAFARHAFGPTESIDTEDGEIDPPRIDPAELRNLLSARFPLLGLYNVPEKVTCDLTQTGLMMGDAIDDLLDITNELRDVDWLVAQGRSGDACWAFAFGYDNHWRYHLRGLLWYLEMRRFEAP